MTKLTFNNVEAMLDTDIHPLLNASVAVACRHLREGGTGTLTLAHRNLATGWLEFGLLIEYGDAQAQAKLFIGCIQRRRGADVEFCS